MLRQLQQQFLQTFYRQNQPNSFGQLLLSDENLAADQRLAIYHGSITESLAGSLREIYPVCEQLVGGEFFTGMACLYIDKTPSTSPDLGEYGDSFADFVRVFDPAAALPYLGDVCQLEWAVHQAYRAQDAEFLNLARLAKVPEQQQGQIIFSLVPSQTLLQSDYPIKTIWQVNQPDYEGDIAVDLSVGGEKLLVCRHHFEIQIDALYDDEWLLLQSIQKQQIFEKVCEELQAQSHQVDVALLLPAAVRRGWITDFSLIT